MTEKQKKILAWLGLFATILVFIFIMLFASFSYGAEFYTVKEGDTLGNIARINNTTWEGLWEINKATVSDPNMIYIGQKIIISQGIMSPILKPKPLTKQQKIDKLAGLMFKVSEIPFAIKEDIEDTIHTYQRSLKKQDLHWMDNQRGLLGRYIERTRAYEIWLLAEAIVTLSQNDEEIYKIAGLAWQESHFVNRTGKCGEISFYQFLPSTVKEYFKLDDINFQKAIWELKNNPVAATAFAILLTREHNGDWTLYNHGEGYQYSVNNKIYMVRKEFTK